MHNATSEILNRIQRDRKMKSAGWMNLTRNLHRTLACGAVLWMATSGFAYEGIVTPLYVGNTAPVLDERGQPMRGSNRPSESAGRCRVELRTMTTGVILPPTVDGEAHPYNPLVSPASVGGMGQNAARSDSGIFCMVFPHRLPAGVRIFARVYNAPTVEAASFYVDSAPAVVPTSATSMRLTFGEPRPMDTRDIDADGLINSWEKSLGTADRLTPDYDGDGITDLNEMLAGTEANNADSLLAIRSVHRESESMARTSGTGRYHPLRVRFQSVPGRSYQLELLSSLTGEEEALPIGDIVTAGDEETELEMLVELPEDARISILRVRLVTE